LRIAAFRDCAYAWSNDVAIGDDNDPATFGRPDDSPANLLLNRLFYRDLRAAAELARRLKREADHARLAAQTRALGEKIQTLCWDPRDRFYYTVDVQCVDRRASRCTRWHSARIRATGWGRCGLL